MKLAHLSCLDQFVTHERIDSLGTLFAIIIDVSGRSRYSRYLHKKAQ